MKRPMRASLPTLLLASAAVLAISVTLPVFASAQTPPRSGATLEVAPEARKAIDKLKSPFCPGDMLAVCPSEGGAMLRDSIQRMAERGLKADSIISIVLSEYGEQYRAQPLASGTGLWAWVLPPLALLVGFAVVGGVLAHRRTTTDDVPVAVLDDIDPETEAKLQAAIKEMDEAQEPDF